MVDYLVDLTAMASPAIKESMVNPSRNDGYFPY